RTRYCTAVQAQENKQITWSQSNKCHLHRQWFTQLYLVLERNALAFSIEQCVNRQSATPFIEGHHDPVRLRNRAQAVVHRSDEWHAVFIDATRFARLFKIQNSVSAPLFHFSGDRIGHAALTNHEAIFHQSPNSQPT